MPDNAGAELRHHGTLWMLDLAGTPLLQADAQASVSWECAGSAMALPLSQAMGLATPTEVLQRFERGCKCYLGKIEREIATYGWVSFADEHIGELDLTIRMPANNAYIWDCATLPAYRGLRLYPALLAYILNELEAEGIVRVWIGADEDNVASQKGMALAGFRPMIDIGLFHQETGPRAWIRGRPGISAQELDDACRAIIGAERLRTM
ncbi:MAG TPA: GNAT family N-acetyltransferase [Ktedonosporobacter sp.]|jgi:GNAT superfamily N-acetyltransferase|nr:GNAT family N-acetyltransferase [Ktedonosporobacter sp.]